MSLLRQGSRGDDVKRLQQILGILADGIFGAQTRRAVIDFQRRHGLVVDGIVGSQTWGVLNNMDGNNKNKTEKQVRITASVLNVRNRPSTSGTQVVSQYRNGAIVDIIGESGVWLQTKDGWIHGGYTENYTPTQTPSVGNRKSTVFTHNGARVIKTTPDNIEIKEIKSTLRNAGVNGITGSFFWPVFPASSQNPNGITINNGRPIGINATHAWRGYKQYVLCYYTDKTFGVEFVMTTHQINRPVIWAFGGISLLPNYDPSAEGFTGSYSDVLRRVTSSQGGHCWIGVKDGEVYLYWRTNCTRLQTRQDATSLGMEFCIGTDSGGSAQIRHPQLTDAHTSRPLNTAIILKEV